MLLNRIYGLLQLSEQLPQLGLYFILPAITEISEFNLFDPEYIRGSIGEFALKNPVYLLDRDGGLTGLLDARLPDDLKVFSSIFYLGIVAIALSLLTFVLKEVKGYFRVFAVMGLTGYLLSLGPYCLSGCFYHMFNVIIRDRFLAFLCTGIMGILLWIFFYRILDHLVPAKLYQYILSVLITGMALFLKPFLILRSLVHHFQNMRSPQWFFLSIGPVAISVMAAYVFPHLKRKYKPGTYYLLWAAALVLLVADFMPYKTLFSRTKYQRSNLLLTVNDIILSFFYFSAECVIGFFQFFICFKILLNVLYFKKLKCDPSEYADWLNFLIFFDMIIR